MTLGYPKTAVFVGHCRCGCVKTAEAKRIPKKNGSFLARKWRYSNGLQRFDSLLFVAAVQVEKNLSEPPSSRDIMLSI